MSATTDWAALYRDHVDAVGALVTHLDDDTLAGVVPGTPEWTVRDVLAHLAGVAADNIAGSTDGAPGPKWTARHVAARGDASVAELVAELKGNVDAVTAMVADSPSPGLVWDIAVHHADLHEALGKHRLDERFWMPVVDAVGARAPELAGSVEPYEIFRAVFSRRSRSQMQAWDVDCEAARLDKMCIFGARDDDQPLPA